MEDTVQRRWRVRSVGAEGSCVEGGFATYEEAAARKDVLDQVYRADPHLHHLTILEAYTPTRPVYEQVRELVTRLRDQIGATNPLLRIVAGQDPTSPLLLLYDALCESLQALAHIVYDEEGHF